MKILAPFSSPKEVPLLIEAGAEELYCGIVDSAWRKSYSYVSSINLRHDKPANLSSIAGLSKSIEEAHSGNAKVFLALNAHFYSGNQIPAVMALAKKAVNLGIDSLIVSDSALIPELKKQFGVEISLSTGNPVFNDFALDFFKGLGIGRVVFPRHLAIEEIGALSKKAKKLSLKTECFALNSMCPNIDGLCTFQHIVDKSVSFLPVGNLACRSVFEAKAITEMPKEKAFIAENHAMLWNNALSRDCGLCALGFFKKFGIDSVKIAGRANPTEKKVSDVLAVKKAIAFLEKNGQKGFREYCRELYFGLFRNSCDYIHCYYAGAGLE